MRTTAVDALAVMFASLDAEEQREVLERFSEVRARQQAGEESDIERYIRSLCTVADYVGHAPSVGEYKQAREELIAVGEDIETYDRLKKHYGSWLRTQEALSLSEVTTARRIEARIRYRRMGKVWALQRGRARRDPQALRRALRPAAAGRRVRVVARPRARTRPCRGRQRAPPSEREPVSQAVGHVGGRAAALWVHARPGRGAARTGLAAKCT
jgi:hypothetical protein